jgi:hypothetical protein
MVARRRLLPSPLACMCLDQNTVLMEEPKEVQMKEAPNGHQGGRPAQYEQVLGTVLAELKGHPNGLRYTDLVDRVHSEHRNIQLANIRVLLPRTSVDPRIARPSRGIYALSTQAKRQSSQKDKKPSKREQQYYSAAANYLRDDLEECTVALPFGGKTFRDKWGTPDVIGTYTLSRRTNVFDIREIVTAEVKLDDNQLVAAFGQSCAYKLFSHKVYLFLPQSSDPAELSRVESLCVLYGIGLVLFDTASVQRTSFQVRNRATKAEPDYYYLNKYLGLLTETQVKELNL